MPVLPWPSVYPPNEWQVPLLLWHASRLRLAGASARQLGSAIVASATRLDSTLSQELPHALARVMAHATRLNARLAALAQMRPSSQPTVHRLLKKHSDECGTGDTWQAGHDAVIGGCVPSE